jgi:hypothetical protein
VVRRASVIPALLAALGFGACGIDFVDPSLPEDARLSVFLDGEDLSDGVLRVTGQLVPGAGPSGGERWADSTLIVLDVALRARADERPTASGLIWDDTLAVDRAGLDAITVVPPDVGGIVRPPVLDLPVRRAAASGNPSAWVPGTDLVLILAPAADSGLPRDQRWRLDVVGWDENGAERPLAELVARAPVPDTLRIDARWLDTFALDSLEAALRINTRCGSATGDSVYIADASLAQRLTWRMPVADPAP